VWHKTKLSEIRTGMTKIDKNILKKCKNRKSKHLIETQKINQNLSAVYSKILGSFRKNISTT